MEIRTVRTAALVGGLATGALLFTGTAAQAADTEAGPVGLDAVDSASDLLGGLPNPAGAVPGLSGLPVATEAVSGMGGVSEALPGRDVPLPAAGDQIEGAVGQVDEAVSAAPAGDLLGDLGGGLPAPLPF